MRRPHWIGVAALVVLVLIAGLFYLRTSPTGGGGATTKATASHASTSKASQAAAPTGSLGTDPDSGLAWVAPSALPKEARDTLALIDKGGPYPYPNNDGVVFSNAEGVLPKQKSGYYHEYTVPTPGASNRGTRRIVTGSKGEFYYTGDHYQTFQRIKR